MTESLAPDICVIGGGAAGLSLAAGAARFGVPTVLIERGKMGGECLNYGCVPSKAMLAAAKRAHLATDSARFGLKAPRGKVDFLDAHAHAQNVIRSIAPHDSRERFAGLGVRVISGSAAFTDPRTVRVGDGIEIRARRFVIATGSAPAIPAIPGLAETPHLTNETIFDLVACPQHLIVIGAGPVGLELAQAHRRLGAEVTVLEAGRPLAAEDPECSAIVLDQLARDGVALRVSVAILRVEGTQGRVRVVLKDGEAEETIEGSHLLVAAGRRPRVHDIGLDVAGVVHDEAGIAVDKGLRTSNRRVYAIGDVTKGFPRLTHVASHHAGLVIRNALFRLPVDAGKAAIPRVTYTDPELAHVGLSEAEARARHGDIRILRAPFHETDRARTDGEEHGHVKLVVTRRGRIAGATIVGPHAGELITPWTLAIDRGLKVGSWLSLVVPYPTLSETGRRAALSYYATSLTSPWLARMIKLLRRFG
jgi:pyruvate/2-oxoglutarate dehydrogenase complex dihydrolipoamide dehydrogenase (E3) component